MNVLKSIGAVLAGIVAVVVLSVGTDMVLEKLGIFPPPDPKKGLFVTWMLLLALVYRCLFTVVGGYITAALAPNRLMRHVVILAVIGTVLGVMGVIVGWNLSSHWYPILLAATAYPCTWWGGKLKVR